MSLDRWYDTWIKFLKRKDKQAFQEINYANLTWKCEVCRKERHDSKIDVMKHPYNIGDIRSHQNIKYCNDKPYCKEMAETHDLFELRKRKNEDIYFDGGE